MMKQRSIRQRRDSSSSDDDSGEAEAAARVDPAVVKEIQRLRQRPKGLSADELAIAPPEVKTEVAKGPGDGDVYKTATGGIVDMKKLAKQKQQEGIGKTFEAETNRRDEDANMLKFIERELAKRRGAAVDDEATDSKRAKQNILEGVSEHLRPTIAKRPEGMLSAQMLMGIPEVDLGLQEKIRNIEATEDAKQTMVRDMVQKAQERQEPEFAPTNMAVNFVQHSRWNSAETERILKRPVAASSTAKETTALQFRVGDFERLTDVDDKARILAEQKSTDDACFKKFKAQQMERRKK